MPVAATCIARSVSGTVTLPLTGTLTSCYRQHLAVEAHGAAGQTELRRTAAGHGALGGGYHGRESDLARPSHPVASDDSFEVPFTFA